MDQKELRLLENRCIQEDAPACTATCPIHVDARTFVGYMARGRVLDAWKVLQKTMPFPGVLGRICDAPCRIRCRRKDVDQAIEIGSLERACVSTPKPNQRILALPEKKKRIAVLGSGLNSLTAAWDLSKKGYTVFIFESGSRLGPDFFLIPEEILPHRVIAGEIHALSDLGVEICLNVPIHDTVFLIDLCRDYDAVYVGLTDLAVLQDVSSGVFVGGSFQHDIHSPVWQAADGRQAATSIDRYLQQVSVTAGREKEGPYTTRLFVRIDDVVSEPAVRPVDPASGYSPDEAVQEAGRCLQCQCLECVKVCDYLKQFGGYPKKYAREIYNNASIVMGTRQANKLVNSCSLCGLCETVCPEQFPMQTLCLEARKEMVQKGKMPPSAHEFALLDMQFSNSELFAMARHEPEHDTSAFVFFPGCQLSASAPEQVKRTYTFLRQILSGGVGLMRGCCNVPALWAGRDDLFKAESEKLRDQWANLGKPPIILACATCYRMFQTHLSEARITSLWQILEASGLPHGSDVSTHPASLAIHDPCTTRHEPGLRASVRSLLRQLHQSVEELKLGRELTECCGFGGLMQNANPDLARTVVQHLADKNPADYLTYCAMCRDNLAASGKRAVHILDLIFPDAAGPDPADRKRPTWSRRQDNRIRLKADLLSENWCETMKQPEPYEMIPLTISPEMEELLHDRRILQSDIRQVIHNAETTCQMLCHPKTGHVKAAFRPRTVMFWVEYSTSDSGFVIHNAYSHRMEAAGEKQP
ncbi:MAG: pyridine nucleotide-disulfide oxidoreductase/dicluster-binding protein [Desulfatirhabdiaceae bacterium]